MDLQDPRSPAPREPVALRMWLFMRWSGVLLLVLVLGHVFVMTIASGGVAKLNWAYVAGRWASPFWQLWDLLTLWLALLHGTWGMRAVIADLRGREGLRLALSALLYTAAGVLLALGSLVIFTFDPTLR